MFSMQRDAVVMLALLVFVVGTGFVASGCEQTTDAAAAVVLPPSKEEELGRKVEREYLQENDVQIYQGQKVNDYIERLGRAAVEASGEDSPDAIRYEFKVVDNPDQVNAFAMPGGQIYFYTGLLKLADSEAEVMAVMSHEVAHVSKRHIAEKLTAAYGLQAVSTAALGDNPGVVAQLATSIASKGALIQFGRKQEAEADEVGFEYDVDAGYDPHGFVSFFEKIKAEQKDRPPIWLSSHPLPQDRIDAAEKRIGNRSFDDATVGKSSHGEIVDAIEAYTGGSSMGETDAGADGDTSPDAGM